MRKSFPRFVVSMLLLLAWLGQASAQSRQEIRFPDLSGYRTLKCDLHTHTVFSDGEVWPTVRINEAWRLGLDAIAVTDHVEYQPHKEDVTTDLRRPQALVVDSAREKNLLLPKGVEITRETPPGHFNAIFLKGDPNQLRIEDFVEQIRQANELGAFVFWNHQGWKGVERGQWLDVHTKLYENKWLHGMEVCNNDDYYPQAHAWCLEKNLTMLGNTDIHGPDLNATTTPANHRTMNLVFVKEKTLDGLKEALFQGRTVVWFKDQLIGRQQWLRPLFDASVRVGSPFRRTKNAIWAEIWNTSDIDIQLARTDGRGPAKLTLPAQSKTLVKVDAENPSEPTTVSYTATNLLVAPKTGLAVKFVLAGCSESP